MSELPATKITYVIDSQLPGKSLEFIQIRAFFGDLPQDNPTNCTEEIIINRWTKEILSFEKSTQLFQTVSLGEDKYKLPLSSYQKRQSLYPSGVLKNLLSQFESVRSENPLVKEIVFRLTLNNLLTLISYTNDRLPLVHFTPPRAIHHDLVLHGHNGTSGIASGYFKYITKKAQLPPQRKNTVLAGHYSILKKIKDKNISAMLVIPDHEYYKGAALKFSGPQMVVSLKDILQLPPNSFVTLNSKKNELKVISKHHAHNPAATFSKETSNQDKEITSPQTSFTPSLPGNSFLDGVNLVKNVLKNHKSGSYTNALVDYFVFELKLSPSAPLIYQSVCVASGTKTLLSNQGGQYIRQNPEFFIEELEAIHQLLYIYHFTNITLTLPFIRTVNELDEIKKIIIRHHLTRSHKFKLFLTLQVPSNILQLEQYLDCGIDGIIIDVRCLTDLTMGIDSSWFKDKYKDTSHHYSFTDPTADNINLNPVMQKIVDNCMEIAQHRHIPHYLYFSSALGHKDSPKIETEIHSIRRVMIDHNRPRFYQT